ncbi:MAG: hypothetical protein PHQ19_04280, partial [Candidatus Krumholzibacteria bacterium]|nr:hypothetical protein [Candidatus Krumholzibacteria bacterium]
AQQLLNKYEVQTGQTHRSRGDLWEIEEQTVEERLPRTRLARRLLLPAVLLAIVVIVLLRFFGGGEQAQPPPDLIDTIPPPGERAPAREGEEAAGGVPESLPPGGEQEPPTGAGAAAERPDTAAAEGRSGREAASQDTERPAGSGNLPEPMVLRILATDRDTTWFDVVSFTRGEAGLDSIPDDFILYPGTVKTLRATESFLFRTIGNAWGFRFELDGRTLPPLGEGERVRKNVRITRSRISGG